MNNIYVFLQTLEFRALRNIEEVYRSFPDKLTGSLFVCNAMKNSVTAQACGILFSIQDIFYNAEAHNKGHDRYFKYICIQIISVVASPVEKPGM